MDVDVEVMLVDRVKVPSYPPPVPGNNYKRLKTHSLNPPHASSVQFSSDTKPRPWDVNDHQTRLQIEGPRYMLLRFLPVSQRRSIVHPSIKSIRMITFKAPTLNSLMISSQLRK